MADEVFDDIVVLSKEMDFSSFDCGNADFNDFIKNEALDDFRNDLSVTYIGLIKGRPVAFVSLVAAAYRTEFLKKNIHGVHKYRQVPAIKIARIATDTPFQRHGCGEALVQYSVAVGFMVKAFIGCKLILTDALPDKIKWYERQGFMLALRPGPGIDRENYPMFAVLSEPSR